MEESQAGLESALTMYEATGKDPALVPQVEHFRGYLKAFRWALLRTTHRQAFLARRVMDGIAYPEV